MLDTDTCVFVMRGPSENLRVKLLTTPIDQQAISVVTLAELVFGIKVSSQAKLNRAALDAFVKHLTVLEWPEAAAEHYGEIRAHLQKRGQMIGANDLFNAAHARSIGAVVVTNNEREFRRVPGLKVENWLATRPNLNDYR